MPRSSSHVSLKYSDRVGYLTTKRAFTETTMEFEGVGEIISTRQLHYLDEMSRKRIVSVFVGKPQPSTDSKDYQCLFQLIGIGHQKTQVARGYDSIQALQSALILAAASIHHLNDKLGRQLVWEGGAKGELGFP